MRAKGERYLPPLSPMANTIISSGIPKGKRTEAVGDLKKMGRPKAEKPKEVKYSIRTDAETEHRLNQYCAAKGISKGEAYRRGIELLLNED